MKAEREWFDPAKRSILAKTSPDSVIDVFSFILLIYHPRRILGSGLFRRDSDTARYVGKRQTSKITQLHDLTLQCAQSLPRGVDGCCSLFPCIPEFCYGTIARPIRP
jgi:hypothetical protein